MTTDATDQRPPLIGMFAGAGNRVTSADDAFVQLLGFERERFDADRAAGVRLSPADWDPVDEAALARAARGRGTSEPYEKVLLHADGHPVPVLVAFWVDPDEPERWSGYAVDLSAPPGRRPAALDPHTGAPRPDAHEQLIGALAQEHHRITSMLDATTDLVWAVDDDLRLISANAPFGRAMQQSIGWTPTPGDAVMEVGFPESQTERWTLLYGRALTDEVFSIQTELEGIHYDVRFGPIRDPKGQVAGTTVVATDVTASVIGQRAVEQRERLLAIAGRLGRVAAWTFDASTRQITMSAELTEMFGLPDRALYGMEEAILLFPERQRDPVALELGRCLTEGTPIDREFLFEQEPGRQRSVRILAEARLGAGGEVMAIDGAIADVTEEHERIAKLREQASLLDNASDAIMVRGRDGIVTYWNRAAEDIFGWTSAEAVGRHIADLVDAGDLEKHERIEEQLRTEGEWSGRLDSTDRDGHHLTIELHLNTITDESGRPAAVLAVSRDVSEQVALEQRLAHSQKLDAIGQLAGGIAHDFNNLLTVISGGAELLREMVADDHEAVSMVEMMLAAATRGGDLTKRLLVTARRQPLRPEVVDPSSAVDQSLQLLRRSLPEAVDIVTSRPDVVWQISVDPAQLEAAILNIALNARDAMDGNGRLTIVIDHVSIDDAADNGAAATDNGAAATGANGATGDDVPAGDYVRLSISDVGRGMSEHDRSRAFDPFFTTKPVGKGSGLGLSMVHGFMRQSGGSATLISSPGAGTTVVLLFPRTGDRPSDELGGGDVVRTPRGHERLLVVEDDPLVREQTVAALRRLGYQVEAVADGPAALASLERADPAIDLVFSDVVMPGGLDGLGLASEISHRWPWLPVVLTSGYHEDHHGAVPPGLTFLPKPYRRSVVARAIRRALDRAQRT